jgi:integrase/recombinase XerD
MCGVRMTAAIDEFVLDMTASGRFNSPRTEASYRRTLELHADDVENRDPRYTNRDDVKRTLRRWSGPNTKAKQRSMLVSFYDYLLEEGWRKDNPARQTRRPRKRPPKVYRLTRPETWALLQAARARRERRAIYLGVCAGLRRGELIGLQGRHFQRQGWVWVSEDIAKGGRERWVPVIADLAPIVDEIRADVGLGEYVLPSEQFGDPGINRRPVPRRCQPSSPQALWRLVRRVGVDAGIGVPVTPHMLRHAFADHLARFTGVRIAQAMLGHADVSTTQAYLGAVPLDDLVAATAGFSFLHPGARVQRQRAPG